MKHSEQITLISEHNLSEDELKKRAGLALRKPYIAKKLSNTLSKNISQTKRYQSSLKAKKSLHNY